MSKTRKTRPLYVRMADKNDHGVSHEEFHDHTNGKECDLPDSPVGELKHFQNTGEHTHCYYHFKYVGHGVCGCPMCTDKVARKQDIRRTRHTKRKAVTTQMIESE